MPSSSRTLASLLLSIALGAFLFYFATDITDFILDLVPHTFFPRRWQEILCNISLVLVSGAPMGALAQRYSAWFGALASIVGDLLMFYYWLQMPPPRAEYGLNYLVGSVIGASTLALSSHLWWVYAFKHRIARSDG